MWRFVSEANIFPKRTVHQIEMEPGTVFLHCRITQFSMSKWLLFSQAVHVLGKFMHVPPSLSASVMYEKKSFHILEQMNGRN